MKTFKILALMCLLVCPMTNQAQSTSNQELLDSISSLKKNISALQTELSLPLTKDMVLDKANNLYKIVKAFYDNGYLHIEVQVSGYNRSRIYLNNPIEAYVAGYHYETLPMWTDEVEFTLKPDVPRIVRFRLALQNYKDLGNPSANRMIDYFTISEANTGSKLIFYSIPILYED